MRIWGVHLDAVFVLSAACYSGVMVFFLYVFAPFYFCHFHDGLRAVETLLFYVFYAGYDT